MPGSPIHATRNTTRLQRSLGRLLREIDSCAICADQLPLPPRPVLRAHTSASLLIVGQAPGIAAHESGIPWNDASGNRLRAWMGITHEEFYDERRIAIVPMGFCYPGAGQSGDLPPRRECAQHWHKRILAHLPHVKLTLLVGQYAQTYVLGTRCKRTLTDTVRAWREFQPAYLPLPHPSGRNNAWLRRNEWFEQEVIPALRRACRRLNAPVR